MPLYITRLVTVLKTNAMHPTANQSNNAFWGKEISRKDT